MRQEALNKNMSSSSCHSFYDLSNRGEYLSSEKKQTADLVCQMRLKWKTHQTDVMYMGVKVSGESTTSGDQPSDRPNVIKGLVREKRATSAPNFAEKNSCFSGYCVFTYFYTTTNFGFYMQKMVTSKQNYLSTISFRHWFLLPQYCSLW